MLDIEVNEEEIGIPAIDEGTSSYKPPINRKATRVDEVYSLYALVPERVLSSLKSTAEQILETNDIEVM